jgi:hypothetical protein
MESHLSELGEEVGRLRRVGADLAEGEGDEHRGEEVGHGEVQEGVLRQTAPALQHGQDHRPGAQEHQRHRHQADGAANVLHQVHLGVCAGGQGSGTVTKTAGSPGLMVQETLSGMHEVKLWKMLRTTVSLSCPEDRLNMDCQLKKPLAHYTLLIERSIWFADLSIL